MLVATDLAAAQALVKLLRKLLDVGFLYGDRRHEDLLARWDHRLVAIQVLRH